MIRKMIFISIFILLITPVKVCGSDIVGISDFDLSQSEEALKNGGYNNIDTKEIIMLLSHGDVFAVIKILLNEVYDRTLGNVNVVKETLVNLLIVIIISAVFTNFSSVFSQNTISETGFYICYLIIISIMLMLFQNFCAITSEFISLLLKFVTGILPAYVLSLAIMGQASAMGFYEFTLFLIGASEFVFIKVVIPLVKIHMAISLVNNISKEEFLSGITYVIKNLISFINKMIIISVTGMNIIQSLILPAVDKAKNTTVRKFIGSLPVVGNGSEGITSIVLGSVNLIKNTIGTFAIIMILVICLIPFIKVKLYSICIQVIGAISTPVADKRIANSIMCLNEGINLLIKIIITSALLFIISIAIICFSTGGNT